MPDTVEFIEILKIFFDSRLFVVLQILSAIISVALIVAIVILIKKGGAFERHIKHLLIAWRATPIPKHKMVKRWLVIKEAMEGEDPQNWRTAIIDADLMLDEVLRSLGYGGDTMDERLENILPEQFPILEEAWRVHQVRNFLVEDPSYTLSREAADKAIELYKDIFRETGIIL